MKDINSLLAGPMTIGWDITHMCNLRCKHCYADAGKCSEHEFTLEEIKKVVDELDELGAVLIALSGGEPLMRRDICDIISYIRKKGIEVFLNTNGTMLTKERINALRDAGLRHFEISFDGLESQHDFIRGKGSFERALRGFDNCIECGVTVGVLCTIFNSNVDSVGEIIDFFHDRGAVGVGFLRFIASGRGARNSDLQIISGQRQAVVREVYNRRMTYGEDFYLKIETPISILEAVKHPDLMAKHTYSGFMPRGCDGGITSCQILHDGTVTFCPQMPTGNFNIHDHSMRYIWKNDPDFIKLRTRKYSGKCGECQYGNLCGGCRVEAYMNSGDVLGEDPGCWK
ncbi:MAG: radical SAM protein [Ruminococcus sp.]|nr:radical SAM protein [Ruminococcus sp.]